MSLSERMMKAIEALDLLAVRHSHELSDVAMRQREEINACITEIEMAAREITPQNRTAPRA